MIKESTLSETALNPYYIYSSFVTVSGDHPFRPVDTGHPYKLTLTGIGVAIYDQNHELYRTHSSVHQERLNHSSLIDKEIWALYSALIWSCNNDVILSTSGVAVELFNKGFFTFHDDGILSNGEKIKINNQLRGCVRREQQVRRGVTAEWVENPDDHVGFMLANRLATKAESKKRAEIEQCFAEQ